MCVFVLQRLMTVSRYFPHLCECQKGRCNADVRNSCAHLRQINNCDVHCLHRQQSPLQTNRRMFARVTWDRLRLIRPCALAQLRKCMCSSKSSSLIYASLLVLGVTADSKYANASATSWRPSPCAMGFCVGLRRSCKIRAKR